MRLSFDPRVLPGIKCKIMLSPSFHQRLHSKGTTQSYSRNFEDFLAPYESSSVLEPRKKQALRPNYGHSLQLAGELNCHSGKFLHFALRKRPSSPSKLLS